jgi:hypothetical protein
VSQLIQTSEFILPFAAATGSVFRIAGKMLSNSNGSSNVTQQRAVARKQFRNRGGDCIQPEHRYGSIEFRRTVKVLKNQPV